MKQLLTTIAAVVLMGCGESQQSVPQAETKPVEPVAEASTPEPPTVKSPDISIHRAADEGNLEAVKQHLAAGTDVDAKNEYGETPLYWAAQGHKEIAELLIAKGVDVNANFFDSGTPLDAGELFYHQQKAVVGLPVQLRRPFKEIIDLLRKHGAKTAEELKAEGK